MQQNTRVRSTKIRFLPPAGNVTVRITTSSEATTEADVHGILDMKNVNMTGKDGYVMTLGFYDDLGYSYTAKFAVSTPKADSGIWRWK